MTALSPKARGRTKVIAVIIGVFAVVVFSEALSYLSPTGTVQGPYTITILIPNGAASNTSLNYSPPIVTLVVGVNNSVQWVNRDPTKNAVHTVIFTEVPANVTASSISSSVTPGIPYYVYFGPILLPSPGTYKYHCSYHPWLTGTIVVKA